MIRNRLAVLLAERQLKISKVSSITKISRTTLTSLAQNDSKMVQLETVNTLCMYLRIPVDEFFEFIPYNFDYYIEISNELKYDPEEEPITYGIEAYINIKGETEVFSLEYSGELVDYAADIFEMDLTPVDSEEVKKAKDFFESIPNSFTAQIKSEFEKRLLQIGLDRHVKGTSYTVTINLF
ncbi:helix-turn-helix transcriptional regulator [Enterococcus devriesei]|uniref:helix-turn-helix domain-containing protein n=1 Tax=Enterococcus devriesei TaxID=319970 RepID=UPI001C0F6B7F|nr:helix-turn-helix transcriptional regulator [Enterococcus devriesei]MBU5366496.1 helix-turn-helix transcriptional regulator [Enterococcus devriesei]